MQMLGTQVGIALQHLPVAMPRDQCDLLDGKASFEEAACAFMAQIVEVQVLYLQVATGAPERSTNRACVVREDAIAFCDCCFLLPKNGPCIEARGGEKWHLLIVSIRLAGI